MARNIIIEKIPVSIEKQAVELIERKGIGHPDTICDAVCESVSRELSKYYLKEFNAIFHHNVDKALLVAGKSIPQFAGGKIIEPIKLIIGGRATSKIENKFVPVNEIVIEAAENYIRKNLLAVKDGYFDITTEIKAGAGNLQEVFKKAKQVPLANDTSFGVAFSPYSETENIVLKTADLINSLDFRKKFPSVGEDIKVMAFRDNNKIKLTIAIAFVDKYISDMKEYRENKARVSDAIIKNLGNNKREVNCEVNTLDNVNGNSVDNVYLTVTGLSAEMGDDGQVGRGNRTNGLITPCRAMSLEASCGKNPTSHTGKVYNVLAQLIANDVYKKLGIGAQIKILSQIGKPIDEPFVCSVLIDNVSREKEAREIADSWFDNIQKITELIINEKVRLY